MFALGAAEVRPPTREIVVDGQRQVLEPRVMQVLVALAQSRGCVVSRRDLIQSCWAGRSVSKDAINRCLLALRRVAAAGGGFSITTIARVGYRLDDLSVAPDAPGRLALRIGQQALAGRKPELDELRRALRDAIGGQGRVVLLAGEPGMGKTRLAQEVAAEAARRGALALTGGCYEAGGAPPYGPFAEALEATARLLPPERLRRELGPEAAQVAQIYPELRRLFADLEAPSDLMGAGAQRYLFSSVTTYLERAARDQARVIILEDLHWAEDGTIDLLRHLARRVARMPVLIVGTYRDVEGDLRRPLSDWLEEGRRSGAYTRLALRGLDLADTESLIGNLVGRTLAADLAAPGAQPLPWIAALHEASRGIPFYVQETVRQLADDGRLFDENGEVRLDLAAVDLGVADGIRMFVGKRLALLDETARAILATAAVAGPRVGVELLAALDDGGADKVLDALESAERAALVTSDNDGFHFGHELIRQTVTGGLSLPRRQHMHHRIAMALQRLYEDDLERHAGEIARHLLASGVLARPDETVRHLLIAGDRSLRAAAFADAQAQFDAALAIAPQDLQLDRARLLSGRGEAKRRQGSLTAAVDDFLEAFAIYERLGDGRALAGTAASLFDELNATGRRDDANSICARAMAAVGDTKCVERARLLGLRAGAVTAQGRFEAGEADIVEAEALATELDDLPTRAAVRAFRSQICQVQGRHQLAASMGLEAAELCVRVGDIWNVVHCYAVAANSYQCLGRWDEADAALDLADPLLERSGNPRSSISCRNVRALIARQRRGPGFRERDRAFLDDLGRIDWMRPFTLRYLGLNDFYDGDWPRAAERFREGVEKLRARDCWSLLIVTSARMGDPAGLDALLAARPAPHASAEDPAEWDRQSAIAEALFVLGRTDACAAHFAPLRARLESRALRRCDNRILEAVVAMAAASGGQWDQSERHFTSALELAERLPCPVEQADVRRDWAQALLLRGDDGDHRTRARRFLEEAAARYEKMDMPGHLRSVVEMIRRI